MRKSYSNQLRLDNVPIEQVALNLESRDRSVPILRALQFAYADRSLLDQVLGWIAADINALSRTDTGRQGMDYWHICVLAAARLGCNFTYDQLQDLAENHRNLRAIMGRHQKTKNLRPHFQSPRTQNQPTNPFRDTHELVPLNPPVSGDEFFGVENSLISAKTRTRQKTPECRGK